MFVTARIADAAGVTAPHAHNPVRFTVEGPGKLIASDNGHPTNFELFQASERKAFSGYVAAIVRPVAPPPGGPARPATQRPPLRGRRSATRRVGLGGRKLANAADEATT